MSNQNGGNEHEFVHLTPENGTNAENDKQQKKMKPLTAFVQVVFDGPANGQEVKLSLNCSTVAEHAAFMLKKLNESQGSVVGLELNGPVAIASVLEGNLALIDYDVPLEVDCKYTFRFKLVVKVQEERDGPNPVKELAKQMEELEKRADEQDKKVEKHQKMLEKEEAKAKLEEEQRMTSAEYARLIGVPNVANLKGNYNKGKLLHLIQHGNMPSIYIQHNQQLKDPGLLQSIVNLLITAEKPTQMVGEVKIEHDYSTPTAFTQPKREELTLMQETPNVTCTFNEASACPKTSYSHTLTEYELCNKGIRFQVLIHKWNGLNRCYKFIYRRLP